MNVSVSLEQGELSGLERVAEGRAATVPEHIAARLLAMGLAQQSSDGTEHGVTLQLTPRGLSFIRSSDQ